MKTKLLLLTIGVALAAGAIGVGRLMWRVHHQLVTRNVRNMPLTDVLRKIEWQTWKKIRAEKSLDARITMHVTNKPLAEVLDWLAEQAGAHWSTVYAVYNSRNALKALDGALRGDGKFEPAGWTKVAPSTPPLDQAAPDGGPQFFRSNPGPDGPGPMMGEGGPMMFKRMGEGPMMIMGNGQVEMWSPEELVVQTSLSAKLDGEDAPPPTPRTASDAARKVHGQWTTYLAFRKSDVGVGLTGMPHGRPGLSPARSEPNERFARLTPAQRVQRARARIGLNK